jgi:hypothetical protein
MSTELPVNAGLEGFDQEDLIVGRRTMVQNTSKTGDPGTFYDETNKQTVRNRDKMRVVILAIRKERTLFYPMGGEKKGRQCWSDDAKTPSPDVPNPVASSCAACPNNKKDLQYNLLCLDMDDMEEYGAPTPFMIRAKGTSLFPVRTFVSSLTSRRKRPLDYIVTMVAKKDSNQKGRFIVMSLENLDPVSEDLRPVIEEAYKTYVNATTDGDELESNEPAAEDIPF